jgi:hypothetical protein
MTREDSLTSINIYGIGHQLAEELVERWAGFFAPKSWTERLDLLYQVHEQLRDDLDNLDLYAEVSPAFVGRLIDKLSSGPVSSLAQAHIYANSDDETHRREAGEWLERYQLANS